MQRLNRITIAAATSQATAIIVQVIIIFDQYENNKTVWGLIEMRSMRYDRETSKGGWRNW
ncbi:MAG: hypothetical protein C4288_18865 [Leptolyngbya sp. ERB_1_1]